MEVRGYLQGIKESAIASEKERATVATTPAPTEQSELNVDDDGTMAPVGTNGLNIAQALWNDLW